MLRCSWALRPSYLERIEVSGTWTTGLAREDWATVGKGLADLWNDVPI